MRRSLGEMAAVAEQNPKSVQQCGDAGGHGPAELIRLRMLGRLRTGCGGFHGSIDNIR